MYHFFLQPALSVPIHVVELTNVPPELRMNTGSPLPIPSDTRQVPEADKDKVGIKELHLKSGEEQEMMVVMRMIVK